jgi:transcriptional regulator with XRE-family HTH domain
MRKQPPVELALRRRLAMNARRARERRGWTQEQAAEHIGCSVQGLQRLERAAARVTIDFVARLAAAYSIDPRQLLAPARWTPPTAGRPPKRIRSR